MVPDYLQVNVGYLPFYNNSAGPGVALTLDKYGHFYVQPGVALGQSSAKPISASMMMGYMSGPDDECDTKDFLAGQGYNFNVGAKGFGAGLSWNHPIPSIADKAAINFGIATPGAAFGAGYGIQIW